jgi:hypothetical protein
MTLLKFPRKLFLSERISLKLQKRRKRKWVHEFSKENPTSEEFCEVHPDTFKYCLRVSKSLLTLFKKGLSFNFVGQELSREKAYLLNNGYS